MELVHFTEATAILSLAVPLKVRLAADVETIVLPGVRICRDGGTESGPDGDGDGEGEGVGVGVGVGVGAGAGVAVPVFPYKA